MNTDKKRCESCGMPIETGAYCQYCADEHGNLQGFDERFARMLQWVRRESPSLTAAEAEAKTLATMSVMPAWRDHPALLAKLGQ